METNTIKEDTTIPTPAEEALDGAALVIQSDVGNPMPDLTTLFQDVPARRVSGGWIEAGEWDGNSFALDTWVDFQVAQDGTVWAKICSSVDNLPKVKEPGDLSPFFQADIQCRRRAFQILEEAEDKMGVITMAREEATDDGWPYPVSVEDYLFWIEEEAGIQKHYKWRFIDDPDGPSYAEALASVAEDLRKLGFRPSRAPWEKE